MCFNRMTTQLSEEISPGSGFFVKYDEKGRIIWGRNFSRGELAGIKFQGPISGLQVEDFVITGCDFTEVTGHGSFFEGTVFYNCVFNYADLTRWQFTDCNFVNCKFLGATLSGCDFSKSQFVKCDFTGADLSDCDFNYARLKKTNLSDTDMRGAILLWADLRGAILDGSWFYNLDLREANLSGAKLRRAFLSDPEDESE